MNMPIFNFEDFISTIVFGDDSAKWKIDVLKKAILDYKKQKAKNPDAEIFFVPPTAKAGK